MSVVLPIRFRWRFRLTVRSAWQSDGCWRLRIVALGVHHYFEHVVAYEDTGERKPSPKPFKKIMDLLGVKPREAIMVGDWVERDIKGAKALGIRSAWAKYGNEFDTKVSGADYVLNDISDIIKVVRGINGRK